MSTITADLVKVKQIFSDLTYTAMPRNTNNKVHYDYYQPSTKGLFYSPEKISFFPQGTKRNIFH